MPQPETKTRAAQPDTSQAVLQEVATGRRLLGLPQPDDSGFHQAFSPVNQCLAISPDNKLLVVADGPRRWSIDSRVLHQKIHLWDIATGKELRRFGRSSCGYGPAAFSADGRTLATADEANRIRLWELASGGERLCLAGHTGRVESLLFAEHGRTLVSTSSDTTALVWDLTGLRSRARAGPAFGPAIP